MLSCPSSFLPSIQICMEYVVAAETMHCPPRVYGLVGDRDNTNKSEGPQKEDPLAIQDAGLRNNLFFFFF